MQVGQAVFKKSKYDALDGKVTVSFASDGNFMLKASKMGLEFVGEFLLQDEKELQQFAQLVSLAWTERLKLKPKFYKTLSGH